MIYCEIKKNKCHLICMEVFFVCEDAWFCFSIKYPVDDNFHMNSLYVHHNVQSVLSFVQWNVRDEAFLELGSILLKNRDSHLKKTEFIIQDEQIIVSHFIVIYLTDCNMDR